MAVTPIIYNFAPVKRKTSIIISNNLITKQMKNFTTLKTLLVGLCAMGATSAWADATTIYERGGDGTAWSDADLADWPCDYATPTINGGLKASTKNAGWTCTKTINTTENSIVTLTATIKTGGASGRNGSYDFVKLGSVGAAFFEQDKKACVFIDDNLTTLSLTYNRTSEYEVSIEINQATGAVNYTIGGVSGTATTANAATSVSFGHYKAGKENYDIAPALVKVAVAEEIQVVSTADYTIKYVCDGEEIKEAVTRTGVVGNAVSLLASDKDAIKITDEAGIITNKYIFVSDDAESSSISGDGTTVITLNFRKAATFSYSAEDSFGETLASGTGFEGENAYYYWAAVKNVDGVLYTAPAVNSGFKGTILLDADNKEATVTYTASDEITTLVYLAEGEDVFTKATGSAADTRGSMGAGGYQTKAKEFVTLPAGSYKLVVSNRCSGDRTGIHVFTAGTGSNEVTIFAADGHGYNQTLTSEEFTLNGTTTLYFNGGSDNQWVDFLYIYKTGDVELPEAVEVNVTAGGYATFCSEYDLDLSGVEAYTATLDGSNVTFTKQTGTVAAGTGLLIKAAEGTVSIPVATEGQAIANNALIGMLNASDVVAGSFVLMTKPYVGFFKTTSTFTCTANTAYIAPLPAEARIVLPGNDATAIKAIEAEKNGEVYNLAGQRVVKAQKGLYIMNGKKVVVK